VLPVNLLRIGCTSSFDSVDKVDPHNSQLLGAMWSYFSHNMEVVNYWLATCVLPAETKQYPSRLVATAWHLAHSPGGNIAGFSGTNDNHRLLPLQVQQVALAAAPQLQGTNGKMLDMLMREGHYATLQVQVSRSFRVRVTLQDDLLYIALRQYLKLDVSSIKAEIHMTCKCQSLEQSW
jgi:hypothetical protein